MQGQINAPNRISIGTQSFMVSRSLIIVFATVARRYLYSLSQSGRSVNVFQRSNRPNNAIQAIANRYLTINICFYRSISSPSLRLSSARRAYIFGRTRLSLGFSFSIVASSRVLPMVGCFALACRCSQRADLAIADFQGSRCSSRSPQ